MLCYAEAAGNESHSCAHVISLLVPVDAEFEKGIVVSLCLYSLHNISVFSSSDSPLPVTSRVCFVKFLEAESVGVSQHLTNTVFVDRALIVVPFAEGGCLFYFFGCGHL